MSKKSRSSKWKQTAVNYKRIVDRATFFRAVDKAGVIVGKLARAQSDMRGGAAATMLAILTLTVLDGKPLTGVPSAQVQASHDEILRTVNRILQDKDYQLAACRGERVQESRFPP